jgi:hypothetical protein
VACENNETVAFRHLAVSAECILKWSKLRLLPLETLSRWCQNEVKVLASSDNLSILKETSGCVLNISSPIHQPEALIWFWMHSALFTFVDVMTPFLSSCRLIFTLVNSAIGGV